MALKAPQIEPKVFVVFSTGISSLVHNPVTERVTFFPVWADMYTKGLKIHLYLMIG